MVGRYKAYPEYKNSGVEWLGNIPSHWLSTKIKYGYDVTLGKMLQKEKKAFGDELRPYLKALNIQPSGLWLDAVEEMWFSQNDLRSLRLISGDVLVSEGGDVGRAAIWKEELPECYIQNAINRVRPLKGKSSNYLYYWMSMLKDSGFIDILCNKATIAHYTAEKLGSSKLFVPLYEEARSIAHFLDYEINQIDILIKKQQHLIQLLKEKRQSVIRHAVTKGLDPNAKMRNSSVEWLGEIPEHWGVKKIGMLFKESNMRASSEVELKYPILSVSIHSGISDKELSEGELDRKISRSEDRALYKVVQANYLAYNMMRAWQGGFGCSKLSGLVSPAYVVCVPKTSIDSSYYELVLRTDNAIVEMKKYSRGITDFRLRLYWEDFKNIYVPVPDNDELDRILLHIEKVNSTYDNLITVSESQIELLQERRTALISAAVTGKIDVRDWVAPEGTPNNKEVTA